MYRSPIYLLLLIAACLTLYVTLRVVRDNLYATKQARAMIPVVLITLLYAVFMCARVVYYWGLTGWAIADPPTSSVIAAISNGIILSWVVTLGIVQQEKIAEHAKWMRGND